MVWSDLNWAEWVGLGWFLFWVVAMVCILVYCLREQ